MKMNKRNFNSIELINVEFEDNIEELVEYLKECANRDKKIE